MKKFKLNSKIKVCILMNSFHVGANIVLNKIIRDKNIEIVGIFKKDIWITSSNKNQQGLLNSGKRWGGRIGYYFLTSLITVVALHFLQVLLYEIIFLSFLFHNRRFLKSSYLLAQENHIPLIKIKDINSSETVGKIKKLKPDVILSNNFNQILKKDILNIPNIGVINIHPGVLPVYRGMLPHFWAMVLGEKRAGVTLHYVDEGVDTGEIIDKREFKIEKNDSFYQVWKKTAYLSSAILQEYFRKLRQSKKNKISNNYQKQNKAKNNQSNIFNFPTETVFQKFRARGKKLINSKDFL